LEDKNEPSPRSNREHAYEVNRLAKSIQTIAANQGVRAKKGVISETLRSSPAETDAELLSDVCATLRLSVSIGSLGHVKDLSKLGGKLLLTSDQEIYFCKTTKSDLISIENLQDGTVTKYDHTKFKSDFSKAKLASISALDEANKNVEQRLKLLNPMYGFGFGNFIAVAVASLFSNILGLGTSLFVMVVYDRVLPNQANETLYALAAGVALAVIFDQLLKWARSSILEYTATSKDKHISNEIFEQFVDTRARNSRSVGSLSTIIRDFETNKDFVTSATILALIDLPFIFVFIYVIYVVGAQLYLVPLICVPIVFFGVLIIQPLLYGSSKKLSDANKSRQGYLVELLSGLDVLRVNGAFAELRKRFVRESRSYGKAAARAKNLGQASGNIVQIVQQFSQVAVIVYGFHLFVNQEITMGAIIATMILSGKTLAPLAKLSQTLAKMNSALIARKNLREFLSQRRKNTVLDENIFDVSMKQGIQIDNVTLRLSDGAKPIFNQFNLQVKRGEKVAIIGKSGSGKTSLIKLLCGIIEPEVGTAYVDGVDVTTLERSEIYRKIGVCFQDPWVFAGSIRENIALGHDDVTDEKVVNALRLAGGEALGNDLNALLDGICTDRGGNLSGGQRQVVALARAFAFDGQFLLLDEPTSSMDTSMEAQFIKNMRTDAAEDKTILLVTHKPALLNACERIIVMEAGRIAWDGSRDQYVQLINERKSAS